MADETTAPKVTPPPAPPVDQLGQGGEPTIAPPTTDAQAAPSSMQAAPAPSYIDRFWNAIKEGVPAFNDKFEAAAHTDTGTLATGETPKMQLVTPEAGMTAKERKAHPIATGIAETVGSMTSPENAAMIAGTAGFGEMGAAGKTLIPKLVSLGFSAQALKGAYDQLPEFKKAMDKGDASEAERILTHITLDSAMGAAAGAHATEGVGSKTTETTFDQGADKFKDLGGKMVRGPKEGSLPQKTAQAFESGTSKDFGEMPKELGPQTRPGAEEVAQKPITYDKPDSMGITYAHVEGSPAKVSVPARLTDPAERDAYVRDKINLQNTVGRDVQARAQGAQVSNQVEAGKGLHPALQRVSDAYRVDDASRDMKYEPSFIRPDGKVVYLGQDWHPTAIEKSGTYKSTENDRTQFLNDTNSIRVRPNMDQREGETFHFTVPEKGVTPEQIDSLRTAASSLRYGNLMFETASEPSKLRSNMARPEEYQFKGAKDVEPILGKLGVLPGQKTPMTDLYGDKGGYLSGQIPASKSFKDQLVQDYVDRLGITHGPKLMDIPLDRLPKGTDTRSVLTHEVGHILTADALGIPTDGIEVWSHKHPEASGNNAAATTVFDFSKIPGVERGADGRATYFPADVLRENLPKFAPMLLSGGVAQDLIHGLPIHQNEGMNGDINQLYHMMQGMGFTPEETHDIVENGYRKAHEILSHPAAIDVLKNSTTEREEGLPKTLHMSKGKVQDIIKQHREARNAADAKAARGDNGEVVQAAESRGTAGNPQGGVREGDGQAVQGQLFNAKPEVTPNDEIANVANEYNKAHGQPEIDHSAATLLSEEQRAALADEYDQAKHSPNDPEVKRAYNAMKQETLDQFNHLQKAGIKFDFTPNDPYPTAADMMKDVRENHHLSIFTGGEPTKDHPLSEIEPTTGQPYNVIFRGVHDVLGHVPGGHDFSENGEESAFKSHAQMYSPEARPAVAAETQGQSNWFFNNKGVREGKEPGEFAQQKATILEGQKPWTRKATDMMDASPAGGINPRTGRTDLLGEVGSEIFPEGRMKEPLDHRPTEKDIQAYYDKNRDVFEKHPELRIGWDHTDKGWELNIGTSGTEAGATKVGTKLDQRAVWHINDEREIPTGGKGEKTSFPDYPLEQRIADMKGGAEVSPTVEANKTPDEKGSPLSTVPLISNPLSVKGSGEGGDITTFDIAKALNKFSKNAAGRAELGKAEPTEMVQRAKDAMMDEAKYQLAQNNTGEHWYTKEIQEHDDVLKQMRPELADPSKMSLFKASEAVLSSGQKPYGNLKAAIKAWDAYQETGKFPETNPETGRSWGPRGTKAYGSAMNTINKLVAEKGEQGAADWLLSKHPISELHQYMEPTQTRIRGKAADERPGAMVLGPKRGPFALNLHGQEAEFTADMWVSRTWNRLMGTMDFDHNTGEILTDAPRNQQERDLMRQSFQATAKDLGKSTSAMQAVMWYYEQALYRAHGIPVESWSFSDAAKRIQKEASTGEEFRPEDREEKHGQTRLQFEQKPEPEHDWKELSPGLAALASRPKK